MNCSFKLNSLGILSAVLCVGFAGCAGSDEPSESDMVKPMQVLFNDSPFKAIRTVELNAVRKIGCVPAVGSNGVVCDVETEAIYTAVGKTRTGQQPSTQKKEKMQLRFYRDAGAWVAAFNF